MRGPRSTIVWISSCGVFFVLFNNFEQNLNIFWISIYISVGYRCSSKISLFNLTEMQLKRSLLPLMPVNLTTTVLIRPSLEIIWKPKFQCVSSIYFEKLATVVWCQNCLNPRVEVLRLSSRWSSMCATTIWTQFDRNWNHTVSLNVLRIFYSPNHAETLFTKWAFQRNEMRVLKGHAPWLSPSFPTSVFF